MSLDRPPLGLLLDMDGTLVDTEGLWFEAEQAAVARWGGHLPDAAAASLLGLDTQALVAHLAAGYGAQASPGELLATIEAEVGGRLASTPACGGAGALVEAALRHGVRCAVVSNSTAAVIEASLAPHPWAVALTLRIGADAVRHPKPAPDLYALALARLGVGAVDCIAVEDSPTGVRAAVAAGLTCLGVAADFGARATLHALTPHVVGSLDDARVWLALDALPQPL
ncbi:MAG: HAD family hydrolase [Trueperaceae bacterium]